MESCVSDINGGTMSRKRRIERVEDDLVNMLDQTMEKMREEVRNKFDSLAASPSQPTNNSGNLEITS